MRKRNKIALLKSFILASVILCTCTNVSYAYVWPADDEFITSDFVEGVRS